MNSILIVDDAKIRREAFREVEKLIKKLERLETNLDAFHREDQRLYSDWINLTFRKNQADIDRLRNELRKLMRFHNWIIGLSKQEKISMPAAILKLRAEELSYQNGNEDTRAKIDEIRRLRDEFILQEIEREYGDNGDADFGIDDDLDDEISNGKPSRTSQEEALFQKLAGYSDKKLSKLCKSFEQALSLLMPVFGLIRSNIEFTLILRIWDSCSKRVQEQLDNFFRKNNGSSLKSAIGEIRAAVSEAEILRDGDSPEPGNPKDSRDFNDHFVGRSDSPRTQAKTPEMIELAKLTYRKLVRALHPDLQSNKQFSGATESGIQTTWQKKTWAQVQAAYKSLDLTALEKLMVLVLIRERRLNDLRVSEIRKSAALLLANIAALESEVKNLKSLPAWGFSRKKDLSSIERKIAKEIDAERFAAQDQIAELQDQHEYLLMLAEAEKLNRRAGSRDRSRQRKKPRPKRSVRTRSSTSGDRQESFF